MNSALQRLLRRETLSVDDWESLIASKDQGLDRELSQIASSLRDSVYGRRVFLRGLIEFSSFCRNDCRYCGLRVSNRNAERYRLSARDILETCCRGYELGFRSFVLQSGEDPYYTDERMTGIIRAVKEACPDAALTISIGERSFESYRAMREAGADRYLLRHETADENNYRILHPEPLSLDNRLQCLRNLKKLGYQTGAGMMVGSPGSSFHTLAEDMVLISSLKPEMVGIGPFIPHHDTPFRDEKKGSVSLTLRMLALVRILDPHILLPSTTALGTADDNGQIRGLDAGANVIMPNLTPLSVRSKYLLYDNKKITGDESAENLETLKKDLLRHGYEPSLTRGDYIS